MQRVIPTLLPTAAPIKAPQESVKVEAGATYNNLNQWFFKTFTQLDVIPFDRDNPVKAAEPPLKGMAFYLDSKVKRSKVEIKGIIEKLGGRITSRITDQVAAVISSQGNERQSTLDCQQFHSIYFR